jgi:hypothetical protein
LEFGGVNGVAECRPPLRRRENAAGYRLKCVTGGNLRVAPLVDVRPDALHGRDAGVGARGFEAVEARAMDRLERKLVLKTRLGAGIELTRRRDAALAIQVRAVTLETQGAGWAGLAGWDSSLEVLATSRAECLRASAFQLSAWKANPLILCELTVFLCHGSQSNRCL